MGSLFSLLHNTNENLPFLVSFRSQLKPYHIHTTPEDANMSGITSCPVTHTTHKGAQLQGEVKMPKKGQEPTTGNYVRW